MRPSDWLKERIAAAARHQKLVWVEDPYRLLEAAETAALREALRSSGHTLVVVTNAFRLREALADLDGKAAASKVVVVDQSYTLRDPHLLPKDAKPSDLKPLPAPDWKPRVAADALLRPTVRDFLVWSTGVEDWPSEVNIYPYERLARERPVSFVRAYETFRRTGQTLTSDALVVVGASAVLGVDLFDIPGPIVALELAFHSEPRWREVAEYFNTEEQRIVREHLRRLPAPLGELFGDNADTARSVVVSLLVLKQHFLDSPGKQLPFLSPALAGYRDCDVLPAGETPPWLMEVEIPRFEKLLSKDFKDHLRDTLKLDDGDSARAFAQRERLSRELRGLVPFAVSTPPPPPGGAAEDFRLDHLVPEFLQLKRDLEGIISATKAVTENLRLTPLKNQTARKLLDIFVDKGFYRIDRLLGRLESLIYYIEGPARSQWQSVAGFEDRWTGEVRTCREAMGAAARLRDDLDMSFGKLLEARYAEIVPNEVLPADLFYEKFMGPRRRTDSAHVKKAVVLLVDSMRFDIWRELLRPALERDYEVEETVGFALLPSETQVSRKGFFAGKPPAALPASGRETEMFAQLVSSIHGSPVVFEDLGRQRPGIAFGARTKDRSLHAVVFDFPDVITHEVDWDPHTLQEGQRHLLTEIKALLAEVGPDALVFITADHGHILQQRGAPVTIYGAEDVGYRFALVSNRIEGNDAAHVFQIPARTLRHASSGWFVFPRPGYALRDADDRQKRFRPSANYRHGGLSMFEVVVPIACLKHRAAKAQVKMVARPTEALVVGKTSVIEISLSADSVLSSPVTLTSDQASIEAAVVSGVSPTPQTVKIRYLPAGPGKHRLHVAAQLAGEKVGETAFDVQVAPAAAEPDAARAKLNKLFGDDR